MSLLISSEKFICCSAHSGCAPTHSNCFMSKYYKRILCWLFNLWTRNIVESILLLSIFLSRSIIAKTASNTNCHFNGPLDMLITTFCKNDHWIRIFVKKWFSEIGTHDQLQELLCVFNYFYQQTVVKICKYLQCSALAS